jgi:hypothetical protein
MLGAWRCLRPAARQPYPSMAGWLAAWLGAQQQAACSMKVKQSSSRARGRRMLPTGWLAWLRWLAAWLGGLMGRYKRIQSRMGMRCDGRKLCAKLTPCGRNYTHGQVLQLYARTSALIRACRPAHSLFYGRLRRQLSPAAATAARTSLPRHPGSRRPPLRRPAQPARRRHRRQRRVCPVGAAQAPPGRRRRRAQLAPGGLCWSQPGEHLG